MRVEVYYGKLSFSPMNCALFNVVGTTSTINVKMRAIRDTSGIIKRRNILIMLCQDLKVIIHTLSCYKYLLNIINSIIILMHNNCCLCASFVDKIFYKKVRSRKVSG